MSVGVGSRIRLTGGNNNFYDVWHIYIASLVEPAPSDYWKDVYNQRKLFDDVRSKLNITSLDGWYKVSIASIYNCIYISGNRIGIKNNATGDKLVYSIVRHQYDNSLQKALSSIYPEYLVIQTFYNQLDILGIHGSFQSTKDFGQRRRTENIWIGLDSN
jgi:hypothetical protein